MPPRRNTPSLAAVLRGALDARLADVRVSLPGIVRSYDAGTQRADVQPAIRDGYLDEAGDRQTEDLPIVAEVPVVFPGAGSASITWPLAAGDEVLLVFSSSSLDRWLSRGGVVDPEDDRRHDLTDAVAIPGLRHGALPGAAIGAGVVVRSADIQLGSSAAADPVIRKSDLDAVIAQLNSHVHSGVSTGGGLSGPRTVAFTEQPGSSVVRAL